MIGSTQRRPICCFRYCPTQVIRDTSQVRSLVVPGDLLHTRADAYVISQWLATQQFVTRLAITPGRKFIEILGERVESLEMFGENPVTTMAIAAIVRELATDRSLVRLDLGIKRLGVALCRNLMMSSRSRNNRLHPTHILLFDL